MTDDDDSSYEIFSIKRKAMQKKRADNRVTSAKLLTDHGIEFTSHNDGAHLRVKKGEEWVDFWPGTGLWTHKNKRGRGVFGLMRYVRGG